MDKLINELRRLLETSSVGELKRAHDQFSKKLRALSNTYHTAFPGGFEAPNPFLGLSSTREQWIKDVFADYDAFLDAAARFVDVVVKDIDLLSDTPSHELARETSSLLDVWTSGTLVTIQGELAHWGVYDAKPIKKLGERGRKLYQELNNMLSKAP